MVTIRTAALDDLGDVASLWSEAGGPTRTAGGLCEATRLLDRDPDALLVAVDHGAVVATVIVGWDGWRCHLYRLAVRHDLRRTGIATALVAEARERALSLGATRFDAMVSVDNVAAVEFWESAGFERDRLDARWSLTT